MRDYGVDGQLGLEPTPEEYVANLVSVFREVWRVLKDDGIIWVNLGDSYAGSCMTGDLKPKDLIGVPWMVAFALRADGWYLRSDIIWCLSGGARVYAKTRKGVLPMTIKDMVRLDPKTVQLWNGEKWVQALGWTETPRPESPLEIELRSGEKIGCTANHEWPTQRGNVKSADLKIGDIIQTCRLPDENPGAFDLHPGAWSKFIGLYIAEGSRSGDKIQIAGHTKETAVRMAIIRAVADGLDGTVFTHVDGNNTTIFVTGKMVNALIDQYVSGHDAYDKHLSPKCWKRPNEFLHGILDGYLMGDGHYEKDNDRWRLGFCRNYNWEQDLRTICARLGIHIHLSQSIATNQDGCFKSFRGEIRFNGSNHHNTKQSGEVVAIAKSRARKFWDIGVADEPHLFALASGVLTHNSKPNPMPESVTDRPTKAHEYLFLLTKNARYYYDADAIKETVADSTVERCGNMKAALPRYGGKKYTDPPDIFFRTKSGNAYDYRPARNRRTVWEIATQPTSYAHFATYPEKLVEPCILAGSRPGDLILDPFSGSGTTGRVAIRHNRQYIGIDLNFKYVSEITPKRLTVQPILFSNDLEATDAN